MSDRPVPVDSPFQMHVEFDFAWVSSYCRFPVTSAVGGRRASNERGGMACLLLGGSIGKADRTAHLRAGGARGAMQAQEVLSLIVPDCSRPGNDSKRPP